MSCKWIPAVTLIFVVASAQADDGTLARFKKNVAPVLRVLCFDCHSGNEPKGESGFDQLEPDLVNGDDAETWHDVLNQLNQGEMPPKKAKQPTAAQRRILTNWMRAALTEAAEAARFRRGRVVTRRLTRYEYANTMRDLLGVDLDFARDLPPEPTSPDGFRNNGSTLEMSPTQIEMYLNIARNALAEAIVTGERPKLIEVSQEKTANGRLPTRKFAGHEPVRPEFALDLKEFPRQGEFEVKVTAEAANPDNEPLPQISLSMGHVPGIIHVPRGEIGRADVSTQSQTFTFRGRMEDFPQPGPISFGNSGFKGMVLMIDYLDGDGKELRYPNRIYVQRPNKKPKTKPTPIPFGQRLEIKVTSVEFKGPVYASWPPPSHQRLLFTSENSDDEAKYIRQLLARFKASAYRRPVGDDEVERTAMLFEKIRGQSDSFEEAVRETFASVLVSPHFLYIVEKRDASAKTQQVSSYELASRLSYFLWSSRPDERLLSLAKDGQLTQPEILRSETIRLLSEEQRQDEFVQRFVD